MPDTNYGHTRIRQLPESTVLNPTTDYLVMENENDTWKVLVSTFNQYIKDSIDVFQGDISDIIDSKFNDIQLLLNENQQFVDIINNRIEEYANNELLRQSNEIERIKNESVRQNSFDELVKTYNDWSEEERKRIANEEARQTAEIERVNAETQRVADEDIRKTNETNRGVAEGERAANETQRITDEESRNENENTRIDNENRRIDVFNAREEYFNNIEESINRYKKEGITHTSNFPNRIVKVLEVALPISVEYDYESLIHMTMIGANEEAFLGFNIHLNKNANLVIGGVLSVVVPNRYRDVVAMTDFKSSFRVDNEGQVIVSVEYGIRADDICIKTSILWDNITIFKDNGCQIYSVVPNNQPCNSNFITEGSLTINDSAGTSAPQGFFNILNNIEEEMKKIAESIKIFKLYPIGSIYQTTSEENPTIILGGGVWRELYGEGITENIIINNVDTYSPVIHYWERTE